MRIAARAALLAATAGLAASTPALAATPFPATGTFGGVPVVAIEIDNVAVEALPDATLVGQVQGFLSANPQYLCLARRSLNVFTAPSAYGGQLVIHNGLQGTQCAYGTWLVLLP